MATHATHVEGLSAQEGLSLLEAVHADGLAHGRRDDPLIMRVAEAIAKLKPPEPAPEPAKAPVKTEHK